MPHPLQRGAVVMYDRRFSVVWEVRADQLVLLPIIRPRHPIAADVALEPADLLAWGSTLSHAVVRPRPNAPVAAAGYAVVGVLAGPLLCSVVRGVTRCSSDAANDRKWAAEKRHSDQVADDRCVNLLR